MTLPTGTVTFLRSDIEASMAHARALGARYDELNAEHAGLVRAAVAEHGGEVVRTEGDAFFAVFTEAGTAARAAVDIQRAMAEHPWPEGHELRVRIGLHTGSAVRAGDDYGGFEVNRAARVAAVGHGGQIVLSDPTRALVAADLPAGWHLDDLGRVRLKGVAEPEHLFGLLAPGLAAGFEPLRSEGDLAEHLPQRLSSFIGRETELAELEALLADTRLLTLVGPGGTGKTTLALELARREAHRYRDGAWFVDLQAVTDPAEVREHVALGVGLLDGPTGTAADRLDGFIDDRSLLLVIDNFEQVISGAEVVADVLAASSGSKVIATSRIALRLAAEQEYPVAPLPVRASNGTGLPEAARLFADRARRVSPSLALDGGALEQIGAICELLDGLPLAIELAAARVDSLPLTVVYERLSRHLPLPGSGPRGMPERQRTIESTTAWSCDLLSGPQRQLLGRLSVFVGSFGYEQAVSVCGPSEELGLDVLDGLVELSERSLLRRADDAPGGLRYRLLETVRAYASTNLRPEHEISSLRARHATAYRLMTESSLVELPMMLDRAVAERIAPDAPNLQAACEWLIDTGQVEPALSMTARLWRLWLRVGQLRVGLDLVEAALRLPGADMPSTARVAALSAAGGLQYWSGDIAGAHARYRAQAEAAEHIGDRFGLGDARLNLAFTCALQGDEAGMLEHGRVAAEIFEELGDARRSALILMAQALTDSARDPDDSADVLGAELQAWLDRAGVLEQPYIRAAMHSMRSLIYLRRGDALEAALEALLTIRFELTEGDVASAVTNLRVICGSLIGLGRVDTAAMVFAAVEETASRHGFTPPVAVTELTGIVDLRGALQDRLGASELDELVARGQHTTLDVLLDDVESTLRSLEDAGERS